MNNVSIQTSLISLLVAATLALALLPLTAIGQTTAHMLLTSMNIPPRFLGEVPVVRLVSAEATDAGTIEVEWYTTERTNGKVVFNTDPSMPSQTNTLVHDDYRGFRHVIELEGLDADTTYYYYVMSEDADYHTARSNRHAFTPEGGEIEDHDGEKTIE